MRMRIIAAWVGSLALLGPGLATIARAQEPADPLADARRAERPKLRAAIVRLRAEVEMLQLDQDIDRSALFDDLKMMQGLEMMSGMVSMGNALSSATRGNAPAARPPAPAGEVEKQAAEARKEAEEKAKYLAKKKAALALRAALLAEKRLDLEDMERQYRETWQAPKPGDGPKRASFEKTEPRRAAAPTSTIQREAVHDSPDRNLTPILDPIPGGSAPCCLDPPTEAEVWAKVTATAGISGKIEPHNDLRFEIEKIGEQVDPVKVYPLAGPCQLVHCHYKCTVRHKDAVGDDAEPRAVTVYIDKDHLRRAATAEAAVPAPNREARAGLDLERRMDEMDRKLDRILKALGDPGRGPRD
jgi:hypothetical protein